MSADDWSPVTPYPEDGPALADHDFGQPAAAPLVVCRTWEEYLDGKPARPRRVPPTPPSVPRCCLPACWRKAGRTGLCRHHLAQARKYAEAG